MCVHTLLRPWSVSHRREAGAGRTGITMQSVSENRGWRAMGMLLMVPVVVLLTLAPCAWGQTDDNWKRDVQQKVNAKEFRSAQQIVEKRIAESFLDLEAHGWRARLLAWVGQWSEAESEYRFVRQRAPNDSDILIGLSDVLFWQEKWHDALQVLDDARALQPANVEILIRRARVLSSLRETREARAQLRQVVRLDPSNLQAKAALDGIAESTIHELRFGADIETLDYTDAAETYAVSLGSRWTKRWSTFFCSTFYNRFGETASKFSASTAYRFTAKDWITIGSATANDNGVVPRNEAFFEYGHAFRFHNTRFRGLESSYQQHWLWFKDAHVLTLNSTQLVYLPRDWTWTLSGTAARSTFSGTGSEWRPAGLTKLGFPLHRRLTANTFFAVGSENFALVDQIGSFSARTYGGGTRFRFSASQDISGYIARQDRSKGRTQTSYGVSYGIRF